MGYKVGKLDNETERVKFKRTLPAIFTSTEFEDYDKLEEALRNILIRSARTLAPNFQGNRYSNLFTLVPSPNGVEQIGLEHLTGIQVFCKNILIGTIPVQFHNRSET